MTSSSASNRLGVTKVAPTSPTALPSNTNELTSNARSMSAEWSFHNTVTYFVGSVFFPGDVAGMGIAYHRVPLLRRQQRAWCWYLWRGFFVVLPISDE
jgi:hypothetical protein